MLRGERGRSLTAENVCVFLQLFFYSSYQMNPHMTYEPPTASTMPDSDTTAAPVNTRASPAKNLPTRTAHRQSDPTRTPPKIAADICALPCS